MTLEIVHRRLIDQIVRTVKKSGGSSLILATCADDRLRDKVHARVAQGLGGSEHLVVVEISGDEADPWNTVRRRQIEGTNAAAPMLYALKGLPATSYKGADGEDPANPPYQRLNLARDAVGVTGSHLLVWLANVGEISPFTRLAPDWWSRRSLIACFLSARDFMEEERTSRRAQEGRSNDDLERTFEKLNRRLQNRYLNVVERAYIVSEQSSARWRQGRYDDALALADQAEAEIPNRDLVSGPLRAQVIVLSMRRAEALCALGRQREAMRCMDGQASKTDLDMVSLTGVYRTLGHIWGYLNELGLAASFNQQAFDTSLAGPSPEGLDIVGARHNLLTTLRHMGRLNRCDTMRQPILPSSALKMRTNESDSVIQRSLPGLFYAETAVVRGDPLDALSRYHRSLVSFLELGASRYTGLALTELSKLYWALGLWRTMFKWRAQELKEKVAHPPEELADLLLVLGSAAWELPWIPLKMVHGLYRRALAKFGPAIQAATAPERKVKLILDKAVALWDRYALTLKGAEQQRVRADVIGTLETALKALRGKDADTQDDAGRLQWALGRACRAANRLDDAAAWTAKAVTWAATSPWRGPATRTKVAWLQASIACDAERWALAESAAADCARHALESDDVYLQRDAWQLRSRIAVGQKDLVRARDALNQGLALVRSEGLRIAELDLIHELAELPFDAAAPNAALEAADNALELARQIGYPRQEARALLNQAILLHPTEPREAAHALREAWILTAELGPRDRRETILQKAKDWAVTLPEPELPSPDEVADLLPWR